MEKTAKLQYPSYIEQWFRSEHTFLDVTYEEWFFKNGIWYSNHVGQPYYSYTKTFWDWFKYEMEGYYYYLKDRKENEGVQDSDLMDLLWGYLTKRMVMPPMVKRKITTEYNKAQKQEVTKLIKSWY